MQRTTLPLNEIVVLDRVRQEMGNITALAQSILEHGLLVPLLVNQDKRLIDGGRRYTACKSLGLDVVDVVYKETITEAQYRLLELECNLRRLDMSWQEKCLGLAEFHRSLSREKAIALEAWGQRETGAMLNVDVCSLNQALQIDTFLRRKDSLVESERKTALLFWQCENLSEAHRLKRRLAEELVNAHIAKLEQANVNTTEQETAAQEVVAEVTRIESSPDALAEERTRYSSNPLNTVPFETYWKEKTDLANTARNTIYISNRFVCGDAIEYMNSADNAGRFDHVITDIPYGVDIENFSMTNLDTVEEEHDVAENIELIRKFFPAAYKCTKENAFVSTWCDLTGDPDTMLKLTDCYTLWEFMFKQASFASFRVQRWPLIWNKTSSCGNQAAQFNYTKTNEYAIVCCKPKTTLSKTASRSDVTASNAEIVKLLGHKFAKPHEVWQLQLEAMTLEGQTILEPFAGCGSGTLAMLRMKRNVISVEKQVTHFNALIENMKTQYYLKQNPNYVFK